MIDKSAHYYADSSNPSSSQMSYQDSFLRLFRDISKLQWVRESFSSHSKHYESLQKRQKKEQTINATLLEKQLNDNNEIQETAERIQQSETKLNDIEHQLKDARKMLDDLLKDKRRLDRLCDELHMLYDEVVPAISDNPGFDDEQNLKKEVYHLHQSIPEIEADIDRYLIAQKELHDARESIAKAMMLLPGASAFLNRQTMMPKNLHKKQMNI
ncbi:hypothetical protein BDA99DRAFT_236147 [Phascolomyces articulosus]|uniref:Uncharacterized protein n=1 Tax=Phascolomyces articulosus TaxID=60185 RepID=A0AAD5PHU7_9FUNG|nr:hypothetical protein BDA99DRAFT_236147 [Phascolomyces articulosus]